MKIMDFLLAFIGVLLLAGDAAKRRPCPTRADIRKPTLH